MLAAGNMNMRIRTINPEDVESVSLLIMKTYRDFNYEEGTVEDTIAYLEAYNPKINLSNLRERFKRTPICYVATEMDTVIGIVRGFPGRLINLFVDGKHHRRGIGRKLLNRFELHCQTEDQETIKANVSIYSIPFYEMNGYKKTTGIRNQKGLKVQPMRKRLTSSST